MRAGELISEIIPPLKSSETGEKAMGWMDELRVSHLPVVDGHDYKGLISENDIYDMADPSFKIKDSFPNLPKPFIYSDQHVYDVMKMIADLKITVVPILDENNHYIGCTDLLFLMSQITAVNSIKEPGSILVLIMNTHDYSLTQIARIVEENNAKVLSSFITSKEESTEIEVTLKINSENIDRIIQTFNRYNYTIKATFQKGAFQDDLKRRYDELMNYLKM
ncbi:CBS domain-containing protein [Paracrocinitomix mangrovi]|uniref:CBS domain-containing protein n=1 Tax=Paracrocinitomix mangrovi TaxID=2862509 RepID=UPI001C8ED898|nr:CBS domain-containing protein [Paracrocinitomix mangrovi]UKN01111.1 CBS domain-containing protein [Paracrocinitomix mangrovi]